MGEQPGHILIVEDEAWNREWLARLLRRKGYIVDIAESGIEALEALEKEPFDLILLDHMMPGMSGIEVLGKVRKKFNPTLLPIIMVTAHSEMSNVIAALNLGANDFIAKPVDFSALVTRVEAHLARRTMVSEQPPRAPEQSPTKA
jgi:two-component system sensor histidine kinase ChiS